jgi:RNA polymerase sigma-70 factor, ECF subfamily
VTTVAAPTPSLEELEAYRVELRGYCYRMLGSVFDADDAVQETLVKAWQARFEGRSSLRTWLYRIATNTCLDALLGAQRRAMPMDLSAPGTATTPVGDPLPQESWVGPAPEGDVVPETDDPAQRAVLTDSVRLAFVAALQHLPPKQRAVLVLREVLCWSAAEVAELLGTTVVSVNSALQRARETLAVRDLSGPAVLPQDTAELLRRYVSAFEAYDIPRLVQVLREDASLSMPPLPLWLRGREDLAGFYVGTGAGCEGSRLVPVRANGMPAFAHYKPDPAGGFASWSVQVLELSGGAVAHVHHFLDSAAFPTGVFARFGLPARLDDSGQPAG